MVLGPVNRWSLNVKIASCHSFIISTTESRANHCTARLHLEHAAWLCNGLTYLHTYLLTFTLGGATGDHCLRNNATYLVHTNRRWRCKAGKTTTGCGRGLVYHLQHFDLRPTARLGVRSWTPIGSLAVLIPYTVWYQTTCDDNHDIAT